MIDPTGLTTYAYDALNRLTSITNNKGFTTSFAYDALGRRKTLTHGNGVVTTYTYDAKSQLAQLKHQLGATTINSFDYTYDKVGNRKSKVNRDGNHNYTYDTFNRLVEAVNPLPTNPLENHTYDPVGNRTDSNQNGLSQFNTANELNEDGDFTYQYENNGNMTRKTAKVGGTVTTYDYDAENKLVRVVSGGTTSNYKYDGVGRRVEKEVIGATTKVSRFIYDQEDILLELDGGNNIVARYTHGPGIDEPLIMEKASTNFFYHADGLTSITDITNQSGGAVQRYTYSSFGEIESQLDPNFVQPYIFTARELEPETGLYFYRARYYDPRTGRFLSEDPIRTLRSFTLYAYVLNDPTGSVDPTGKVANIAIGMVIGGTIGGFSASLTGESLVTGILTGAAMGGVAGATFGGSLLVSGAVLTIGEASVVTGVSAFTITSISKALQGESTCRTLIDGLKAGIFTTATGFLGAQFAQLAGDVAVGVAPGFSELVQRFFSTGFSVLGAEVGAAITLSEQFDQQRRQKSR